MSTSKTILVKTVIGKGFKASMKDYTINMPNTPDSVLGCWVINHIWSGENKGEYIEVRGSYEIHLWYAFDEDRQTEVISRMVEYTEKVKIRMFDEDERRPDSEILVDTIVEPMCINMEIVRDSNNVKIDIETSFGVRELAELYLNIDAFSENTVDFGEEFLEDEEFEDLNGLIDFLEEE